MAARSRWDRFAEAVRPLLSRASELATGGAPGGEDDPAGRRRGPALRRARDRGRPAGAARRGEEGRGSRPPARAGLQPDRARRGGRRAGHLAFPASRGPASRPSPDGRVRAGAGLRLKNLCGLAAAAGLSGLRVPRGDPGKRRRGPQDERGRHGRLDLRRRRRGAAHVARTASVSHAPALLHERGLPPLRRAAARRSRSAPSCGPSPGADAGAVGQADRRVPPQAPRVAAARAERRVHLQEPARARPPAG